jgi:hypothetical protein
MNKLLTLGIIGGLIYLSTRLVGLKRISDNSVVRTLNPRIHKADTNGLVIITDIELDNPTNTAISITKPVITLSTGGKYLASSVPQTKTFTIAPQTQTSLEVAEISIPWMSLTGYIGSLITKIPSILTSYNQSGKLDFKALAIPLEYKYSTYINNMYYESPVQKIV